MTDLVSNGGLSTVPYSTLVLFPISTRGCMARGLRSRQSFAKAPMPEISAAEGRLERILNQGWTGSIGVFFMVDVTS